MLLKLKKQTDTTHSRLLPREEIKILDSIHIKRVFKSMVAVVLQSVFRSEIYQFLIFFLILAY
jgi:hypothetical protein